MVFHPWRTVYCICSIVISLLLFGCHSEQPSAEVQSVEMPADETDSAQVSGDPGIIDIGLPTASVHSRGKIHPVDEGPLSTDFLTFRSDFLRAVRSRDTAFVMQLIRPSSKISFGAEGGKMGFRIMWGLGESPEQSPLWDVLDNILQMGGQFLDGDRGFFIAPYTYSAWPDEYDAFDHAVITGENVRVRVSPDLSSPVVTALSYDIVKTTGERTPESVTIGEDTYPWYKITLPGQQSGWVFGKYIRSPIDLRIGLKRGKEDWYIAFFVAGD